MRRRLFLGLLAILLRAPAAICTPPQPDLSGTWKQSNERCLPVKRGDVTRRIDQRGSSLVVETSILRPSGPPRHAVQRFTTDGVVSVSTGADGDEFHTSATWNGQSLVFSIEEHEDGRILHSREIWELLENGATLQVKREALDASADGSRSQTMIYLRQPPGPQDR